MSHTVQVFATYIVADCKFLPPGLCCWRILNMHVRQVARPCSSLFRSCLRVRSILPQVLDTQPLRASAVLRLNEPAEVILVVMLVGPGGGSVAAAGTSSTAVDSCPPLPQMEAALEDGVFVIDGAAIVLKLDFTSEHIDGLQTCVLPLCQGYSEGNDAVPWQMKGRREPECHDVSLIAVFCIFHFWNRRLR